MVRAPSTRFPRFKRCFEAPSVRVTSRDREIIRQVFRNRFLRSTHLHSLLSGSRQGLLRRLQRLFHHGYLDRPRAQIDHYHAGSQAMVYGVGREGVKLLERDFGIPRRKVDWTAKNRTATRYFLDHTLAVADVMVAMEIACRQCGHVELIDRPLEPQEPFKWSVRIQHSGNIAEIGVVPDRVFGLLNKNRPHDIAWFFLEADRATMPVRRHSLKQTSMFRKFLAYHETWRQQVLSDSFPRFRVLTVTTTPARVQNLIETSRALNQGKGSGLFLFTDKAAFLSAENPLTLPLLNGRAERVTLLD